MTNDITAMLMMARHATSPSSPAPAARRSAALGLDRSARPSKLSAMPLMPPSRCSETKFTLHRNPLHKTSDTPAQGVAHFRKARTGIGAIFLRDVLRSQMVHAHGKRSCSNRRISGYEIDCLAAFKSLRKTAGSGLAADSSPSACHRDCVGNGTPPDSLVEARRAIVHS